jgi:hypothetical protein
MEKTKSVRNLKLEAQISKLRESTKENLKVFSTSTFLQLLALVGTIVLISIQGYQGSYHHNFHDMLDDAHRPEWLEYYEHWTKEEHPLRELHRSSHYVRRDHVNHHSRVHELIVQHPYVNYLSTLMGIVGFLLLILIFQTIFVFFPAAQQFTIFVTGLSVVAVLLDIALNSLWLYLCIVDTSFATVFGLIVGMGLLLFSVLLVATSLHITENTNTALYILNQNSDFVVKDRDLDDKSVKTLKKKDERLQSKIFDLLMCWKTEMQIANKKIKKN